MSQSPAIESAACITEALLLREFTGAASAGAFAALVTRYGGLVHGTARRILEDEESARDVTQEVFPSFAREARRVRPDAVGAWLHTAARRAALNELRGDSRRRHRELATINACGEWLHTRAPGPLTDPAYGQFAIRITREDPGSAWQWAQRISDPKRRAIISDHIKQQ